MGQGWKRLPLLVIFLLFWKNTDGFKGGAYSNAHHQWGQPLDTFSPHAVQSPMSETRVTGTLPVEVGSSLLSNKPLKSRSKFNLLQFVKGGSSSSQSTSHAQTAPGSSVSASWPQPLGEQPLSSLTPAGSTASGAASGLNLQTLYAARGSGRLVSTQGGSSSYPAELGVSGQSTSDGLHSSTSQETSVHQSAETSLPVFSQSISYSSSAPGATSTSQSSPILPVSLGQPVSSQGEGSYSGLSPAASSQYAFGYSKPISSPQSTSSQSAGVLSPHKQYASASQGSSGAKFGASTGFASQGMSSSYSGTLRLDGTTSQFTPGSPSPYDSLYCKCALSPQGVDRESTTVRSPRKQFTSRSGTQSGSSPFTLQGSIPYDRSPWPQGTASQLGPVSRTHPGVSSPSRGVSSRSIQFSQKQLASTYTGSSGTQAGSSTPFTMQGSTAYGGSPQDAASPFAHGPQSSYASVSLSSPQASPSTPVQGSRKQFTSTYVGSSGTQGRSSTHFTLQGSIAYGGSPQPQDAASQLVRGSSYPYASVPLSSPQGAASQSSQSYQGYPVFQRRESKKWQPSATRLTPVIGTSDATASQGSSSSQSSPMPFSSLSSAGGSSRVSGPFVSAHGGSTSYGGSFQSPSLSTKYTPVSQHLPYDTSVAGQGTSSASASEVLSSYSSTNNQNAPAHPSHRSSSSRFYSVKG